MRYFWGFTFLWFISSNVKESLNLQTLALFFEFLEFSGVSFVGFLSSLDLFTRFFVSSDMLIVRLMSIKG